MTGSYTLFVFFFHTVPGYFAMSPQKKEKKKMVFDGLK